MICQASDNGTGVILWRGKMVIAARDDDIHVNRFLEFTGDD
jgi:hypothetical protein